MRGDSQLCNRVLDTGMVEVVGDVGFVRMSENIRGRLLLLRD
jgi:hypothetical protein